jgi:hypothetical protein
MIAITNSSSISVNASFTLWGIAVLMPKLSHAFALAQDKKKLEPPHVSCYSPRHNVHAVHVRNPLP